MQCVLPCSTSLCITVEVELEAEAELELECAVLCNIVQHVSVDY